MKLLHIEAKDALKAKDYQKIIEIHQKIEELGRS